MNENCRCTISERLETAGAILASLKRSELVSVYEKTSLMTEHPYIHIELTSIHRSELNLRGQRSPCVGCYVDFQRRQNPFRLLVLYVNATADRGNCPPRHVRKWLYEKQRIQCCRFGPLTKVSMLPNPVRIRRSIIFHQENAF